MNEIGKNLRKIRLLKNLSLNKAGNLLNMSATAVKKYEDGSILPNSKKLIEFANAYNVNTFDFLQSYDNPKMKFTSFRKRTKLKGKKLDALENCISDEVANYLDVIKLNDICLKNNKLKKYNCNSIDEAESCAEAFRNDINYSNKLPLSDLISILENIGVIIIVTKTEDCCFDGLSEFVEEMPVIVIKAAETDGARQRFTIAHELGHLVLNINDNIDNKTIEKICDRFAGALLIPKEALKNEFGNSRDKISFYELDAFKNEYKVSYTAIIYRLKDLGVISEYSYRNLCIQLNKKIGKNDPYPITPEKTYQFEKIVRKLEIDNIISTSRACELLGVSINEYNN